MTDYNRFEDPRHIKWAQEVKKKDKYTCQICGISKIYLHSHHKDSWDWCEARRFDISNGVTLCHRCHELFHQLNGAGQNTEYQFEQFSRIAKMIHNIAKTQNKK